MKRISCCDVRTQNLLIASIAMMICVMAGTPSAALQNIALAESTDLAIQVGYYSEIVGVIGSIIMGFIFPVVYRFLGIKLTTTLTIIITTAYYWTMIWVVNEYLIYLGGFLAGLGWGGLWIICPMVVMDNSQEGKGIRNMAYFWMAKSLGDMIGGLCGYAYFDNITVISETNRFVVYGVCVGITCFAAVLAAVGLSEIKDDKYRHQPLENEVDVKETNGDISADGDSLTVKEDFLDDKESAKSDSEFDISKFNHSVEYTKNWFNVMVQRLEFWMLLLPLVYWAFIWGYFYKILPTATASISDKRGLIPLTTVIIGASYLIGSASWNFLSRWMNSTLCIVLQSLMLLASLAISILIFPKGAASGIDISGDTYITPDSIFVVIICALIGLADSGISITFYTVSGIIFGEGTSVGFAVVNNVFYIFYIFSMFAPSLFDLHSYCYSTGAMVVVMCISMTVGLRKFL